MKKYRKQILILMLMAIFTLVGCGGNKDESKKDSGAASVRTFTDWTDLEILQDVPAMLVDGTRIGEAADYGAETYVINVQGTSLEDYRAYLSTLESVGYEKYVDNGEDGLDGCVYSATYQKDEKVLTVVHAEKTKITYISASKEMNLSEHLFYSDEYVADNQIGAKTTLHMPELHTYGESYIIQMKNGHFILIDGGMETDTPYLFDYLDTLVSKGEKPIVEAWFITHGHGDHIGPFTSLVKNSDYASRVAVEGVYFTEPSKVVCSTYSVSVENVKYGTISLRTTEGEVTPLYRPQTGQRYYFNDITIDVLHTQEQLLPEEYENGFNDSSSWLMFTIDGQKFLDAGDTSEGAINVVKRSYNQDYFDLQVMSVFHHGQNVYDSYIDYFDYKVAIYPTFVEGSQTANHQTEENDRLKRNAVETMSWGDGTKILTFPYVLGTVESLSMREWIYHTDRPTPAPY